ncbi:MAG: hypothetical protein WAV83_07055 [Methanothrix sp.]|jgi:hypothetical protein|uniref:hypothetical protein n=1 Tax=Methanothrix sp. TaxID=90426 RepID=UPI0032AEEE6B
MNRVAERSLSLLYGREQLDPFSQSRNVIGFCGICDSELESLAYYCTDQEWLISARCKRGHLALLRYDREWNWKEDLPLEFVKEEIRVSDLDGEMLNSVFTPAEIRDMIACQQGRPYTRQNIYRARAKYERFEKLFGIKIEI